MEVIIALLCTVITLILISLKYYLHVPPRYPPGPKGSFLLGYIPYMKPRSYIKLAQLKAEYGDVVSLRFGIRRVIVLLSYRAINEALVKKSDNFAGRLNSKFHQDKIHHSGIVHIDGSVWQEHRRFSMRVLRDFGVGRNISEQYVQEEAQRLVEWFSARSGRSCDPFDPVMRAVSSVICSVIFSEHPAYDDDEFNDVFSRIRDYINTLPHKVLPFAFPFLAYLGGLLKFIPSARKFEQNLFSACSYIQRKIENHRSTIDWNGEPRDFTDAYLQEQAKHQASGEPHTFTEWQLIRVVFELFAAGTDTTSNSLSWFLLLLGLNPDIQSRVQQEIDAVIGRDRLSTMKDKLNMPYLSATLDEVQRFSSIVPNSLHHRNFKEDTICGYQIPANSTIIPCIYSCHHDPDVWSEPSKFSPERFLSDDGKEYKPRDELIPFSLGRRSCLGESLAKMELFVFSAVLMQRLSVRLEKHDNFDVDKVLMGSDGIVRSVILDGCQVFISDRE